MTTHPIIALALSSILLSGCASVSITAVHEDPSLAPARIPDKITAVPTSAVFHEDDQSAARFARGTLSETLYLEPETGHSLSRKTPPHTPATGKALSRAANKQLARFLPSANGTRQEIKIDSRITSHQKGSRALRTLIGLGAGKTLFETKTIVYNVNKSSTTPWLEVWTTGNSGREPGAIFAASPSPILAFNVMAAVGTSISIANGSGKGLTQDAKRTGKLIGSFVLERLRASGLPINGRPDVKYSGRVTVPLTGQTVNVPLAKTVHVRNDTVFLASSAANK